MSDKRNAQIAVDTVFVSYDNTAVYFNIRGGKNIDRITIDDTTEAIENNIKNVRPLTSPLRQFGLKSNRIVRIFSMFQKGKKQEKKTFSRTIHL